MEHTPVVGIHAILKLSCAKRTIHDAMRSPARDVDPSVTHAAAGGPATMGSAAAPGTSVYTCMVLSAQYSRYTPSLRVHCR